MIPASENNWRGKKISREWYEKRCTFCLGLPTLGWKHLEILEMKSGEPGSFPGLGEGAGPQWGIKPPKQLFFFPPWEMLSATRRSIPILGDLQALPGDRQPYFWHPLQCSLNSLVQACSSSHSKTKKIKCQHAEQFKVWCQVHKGIPEATKLFARVPSHGHAWYYD